MFLHRSVPAHAHWRTQWQPKVSFLALFQHLALSVTKYEEPQDYELKDPQLLICSCATPLEALSHPCNTANDITIPFPSVHNTLRVPNSSHTAPASIPRSPSPTLDISNSISIWTTNKFCDLLATMPSLHFGYSLIVSITLCVHAPARRTGTTDSSMARMLFLLYPTLILLTIVATVNHYLLDALTGLIVAALTRYTNAMLVLLLVLENDLFRMLHIHKLYPAHVIESQSMQDTLLHFAQDTLKHPEDCID